MFCLLNLAACVGPQQTRFLITTKYCKILHSLANIHQGASAPAGSESHCLWHASGALPRSSCSFPGHGTSLVAVPPLASTVETRLLCWTGPEFCYFVWQQRA